MNELKHFDLESRKGKAPGGYNCPLAESGAPFIFMNAAGQMSDVTTMVHEGGHAVHSFSTSIILECIQRVSNGNCRSGKYGHGIV